MTVTTREASRSVGQMEEQMAAVPAAVQRFLAGLEGGRWDGMEEFFTPDAIYDASVPGYRYRYQGPERIVQVLREEWTRTHTWRIVECRVSPTADGVVLDFEMRGLCPGDGSHSAHEEACRIANIFRLEGGRIAEHRYYCC